MPCYHPLKGYRARHQNQSGKRSVVFKAKDGFTDLPVTINCGQCIGCRLERSRQWAIRCVHEAQLNTDNSFITLTYDNKNIPRGGTLKKEHFQKFMKRLRFKLRPKIIRYYHCGEYGENTARPHYHALIFNHAFPDKIQYSINDGNPLYISEELNKLWTYGFSTIGELNFDTAAYVARYVLKKVNGPMAEEHYQSLDPETGELSKIEPEYTTMSRRPGIGSRWYDKYKSEVYPNDDVIINGKKMKPPRYYDGLYEKEAETDYGIIVKKRKIKAKKYKDNQTPERLKVRENVTKAGLKNRGN